MSTKNIQTIQKPHPGEYNPYFQGYMDLVPAGDFMDVLRQNTATAISFFENIPMGKQNHSYAEGKWTIKQVLIHITDVERVMGYRALVASRGDIKTPLYSMDDNLYVQNAEATHRDAEGLIQEFKAVRAATEAFYTYLTQAQSTFKADAVTFPITARAAGFIIVGHLMHHMQIMKERYLKM